MGTTSEKLSYLNTTKTKIKEALNLGGANITNETFRQYIDKIKDRYLYYMLNGTQVIWNNWNKVSGTGTSLTLNNTEEAPMSLTYKGNTSQSGTPTPSSPIPVQVVSGDNSIEVSTNINNKGIRLGLYQIVNGEYASPTSGNRYATFNDLLEVQPNTTYKVTTTNNINAQFYQLQYNESKTYLSNSSSAQSVKDYTFTTGATTKYLAIDIRAYDSTNITTDYVGGIEVIDTKASYPITLPEGMFLGWIPNTTYQDKIDKSTGKNLFDKDNINLIDSYYVDGTGKIVSGTNNKFNWVKLEPNKTYTLKQPITSNVTIRTSLFSKVPEPGDTGTILSTTGGGNPINITFATNDTNIYLGWVYCNTANLNNHTQQEMLDCIMINVGQTALPYEPYGTNWYLKKEIGKTTIIPNNNWLLANNCFQSPTKYPENIGDIQTGAKCNQYEFKYYASGITTNLQNNQFGWNSTKLLTIKDTRYSTVSDFVTAMTNEKPTLYYILATPTYETITDTTLLSQLEALKKSYKNITNISQVNNDLPFELDVTALSNQ